MSYTEDSVPDQTGKTIVVTGANTGIGYDAARVLAERGARVLLACRSEDKATDAMERIKAVAAEADLKWIPLDLTNLESVKASAEMISEEEKLDVLINNAGVMVPPKTLTDDGFELQFGVNHLGHFALTGHLMDKLLATPGARVVNVSSLAHRQGWINFTDPHAESGYSAMQRYQMSKAANIFFTLEMARRCERGNLDITCVACHPGGADTELSRYLPSWFMWIAPAIRPLLNTSAEGALPTLLAATKPDVEGGDYFGPVGPMELVRSAGRAWIAPHVRDKQVAQKLWDLSTDLTGVSFLADRRKRG